MPFILVRYVMTAALRDRLILALFILLALCTALSIFLGSAAIIEKNQFMAVYAAGTIQIANVFGLSLFTISFIRRSFEARDVEFMLSRPVSRTTFLLSYALTLSCMATCLGGLSGTLLAALSPHAQVIGTMYWAVGLIFENIIMVNVALFFSMVLESTATGAFATLGFFVLARMMSQILGIIDSHKTLTQSDFLEWVMQGVSFLMPRLDLMTQSSWILYGVETGQGTLIFIIAQGFIYTALVLLAALLDLRGRQF